MAGNPNWVKGRSGNPRGRAKSDFTLAALAKKHTHEAIKVLVQVLRDTEHPQRITAAKELLDRGWGKAPLVLAGEGGVGPTTITIRLEQPMPVIGEAEIISIAQ